MPVETIGSAAAGGGSIAGAGGAASFDRGGITVPAGHPGSTTVAQDGGATRPAAVATAVQQPGPAQADPGARRMAVPEIAAGPAQPTNTLDQRVARQIGSLQKSEAALAGGRNGVNGRNEPSVKVGKKMAGPAEKNLSFGSAPTPGVAGDQGGRPGGKENLSFDGMIQQMKDVSSHAVQVSIVSKTTSTFTGSMNKLMSSQ